MINKFQQGGKQNDAIVKFVQGLAQVLQSDPNQIIQIAQQNPEALKAAVQVYQKSQNIEQAAQVFVQTAQQTAQSQPTQQQVAAARHGAKLQYVKSLKHQCAEDEELYYFKKGGKAGCGCKKKDGGEIKQKEENVVTKFKKAQRGTSIEPSDTIHTKKFGVRNLNRNKQIKNIPHLTNNEYSKLSNDEQLRVHEKDETREAQARKEQENKKIKKDCGGSTITTKFKMKCGAKVKKHQYGDIITYQYPDSIYDSQRYWKPSGGITENHIQFYTGPNKQGQYATISRGIVRLPNSEKSDTIYEFKYPGGNQYETSFRGENYSTPDKILGTNNKYKSWKQFFNYLNSFRKQ